MVQENTLARGAAMDREKREAQKIPSRQSPLIRRAWLNVVLLILAALSMGSGIYLRARPEWTKRPDVAEYNLGIVTYNEFPTARGASTTEKAAALFEKALVQSSDQKVKALSLCNVGTINGKLASDDIRRIREAYAVRRAKGVESDENLLIARQELRKAIQKLAEAVRIDPTIEDAKFNLELLEKERGEGEVLGSKYSPGQVEKGY
jgi:tetratricopeptide (TPR) repeat protein